MLVDQGIRVIGIDQRGVLRSDPLPEGAPIDVPSLIDDFEAVRTHLGIPEWFVLGHSAGGGYALDYAVAHPDSIRGAIFDCPAWDCDATDRYRLPVAADLLDEAGKHDAAGVCRNAASSSERLSFQPEVLTAMQQLGPDYMRLFTFGEATRTRYTDLMKTAPDGLDWTRGLSHMPLVADMYEDRTLELSQLHCPSLLIHGVADLVAPPSVIETYRRDTGEAVTTIEQAGHFAFVEQPDEYARAVASFVIQAQRDRSGA
ncbi:alpha/beta fold hydrolase [Flexivirga sp. B27]